MANYRPVEIGLLVLLLAFTATNIGLEGRYLMKRLQICNSLNLDNCTEQKNSYLFDGFRNLTMKFFADCINLGFIIGSFFAVIFVKKQYAPNVSRVLFVIILALTLMSLGTGVRSIDQEDDYNKDSYGPKLEKYCTAQSVYDSNLSTYQSSLDQYNKLTSITQLQAIQQQFASGDPTEYVKAKGYLDLVSNYPKFTDATKVQSSQGVVGIIEGGAKLKTAKDQLDAAIPQVKLANKACPEITDFKNIYERYRNSVVALVIINFVWAYTLVLQSFFRWNNEQEENNRVKLTGTDLRLQDAKSNDLLKNPNTDIEMNAQNAM